MSLREGKRSDGLHRLHSRPLMCSNNQPLPPPLISDNTRGKGTSPSRESCQSNATPYRECLSVTSCSCPPFECLCNDLLNQMSYQTHPTTVPYSGYESSHWPNQGDANGYYEASQSEEMYLQPCDFTPLNGDIFQPEEIFQLDHPLREQGPSDAARSPTIILDLGNGSNEKDLIKSENWLCRNDSAPVDDSSSSCSRYPSSSPNFPVFQQPPQQDYPPDYHSLMKAEEVKDASFPYSCDVESEKMKLGYQNAEYAVCFPSEDPRPGPGDCLADPSYEDVRHRTKVNGKNYSAEYNLFPEIMTNPEDLIDCHQTLNKMCASLDSSFPQKSIQDPLYFLEHADVRMGCDEDNINGYLHHSQLYNNQSHFPSVPN